MIVKLFGGINQPPEELTCLTMLGRQKSVYRIGAKRLVEKAPVQSPSISMWEKNGHETQSAPIVEWG